MSFISKSNKTSSSTRQISRSFVNFFNEHFGTWLSLIGRETSEHTPENMSSCCWKWFGLVIVNSAHSRGVEML